MPPAPLDASPVPPDADRRQVFVDWLTRPDNPYFAKAIVNRVWRNFFGRGLVEAEDDLRETNPPTNPELLDALAQDFIKHRYDVKQLIRTVMASAAYQRSAVPVKGNEADDRFISRGLPRRLSAEVLLDAYSQITGVPTDFDTIYTAGRVPTKTVDSYPRGTRAQQLPDSQIVSRFLDAFGRAERMQVCSCERQSENTVEQALTLNNGVILNDKLRAKDSVVSKWLAENVPDAEVVARAFRLCLGRDPTPAEVQKMTALLGEKKAEPAARREALEDLFWALLTSREFVFNH